MNRDFLCPSIKILVIHCTYQNEKDSANCKVLIIGTEASIHCSLLTCSINRNKQKSTNNPPPNSIVNPAIN